MPHPGSSALQCGKMRSTAACMVAGRPSQKALKWCRRKAITSCGCSVKIASQTSSMRSRSPSIQRASASIWAASRVVVRLACLRASASNSAAPAALALL